MAGDPLDGGGQGDRGEEGDEAMQPRRRLGSVYEKDLVLIDFEYASYNFRGFDFANHFAEWSIDYTTKTRPFFTITPLHFPSEDKQRNFFLAYREAQAEIDGQLSPNIQQDSIETLVQTSHFSPGCSREGGWIAGRGDASVRGSKSLLLGRLGTAAVGSVADRVRLRGLRPRSTLRILRLARRTRQAARAGPSAQVSHPFSTHVRRQKSTCAAASHSLLPQSARHLTSIVSSSNTQPLPVSQLERVECKDKLSLEYKLIHGLTVLAFILYICQADIACLVADKLTSCGYRFLDD